MRRTDLAVTALVSTLAAVGVQKASKMDGLAVGKKMADFVTWFAPGVVKVSIPNVGSVYYRSGWCGDKITLTVYTTPFSDTHYNITPEIAEALYDADDWWAALAIIEAAKDEDALEYERERDEEGEGDEEDGEEDEGVEDEEEG